MASVIQHIDGYSGGYNSGQTFAFPGNVTAGNAIIVMLSHTYLGCPPSITDTQGNTYTSKGSQPSDGSSGNFWIFTAVAGSTGANTLTVSFGCGFAKHFLAVEASGMASDPFDVQGVLEHVSTYGAAITTTEDGELILAMWSKLGSDIEASSVDSPMSFLTDGTLYATASGFQTSAGSITPTVVGPSGTIDSFSAGFKVDAVEPPLFKPRSTDLTYERYTKKRITGLRGGFSMAPTPIGAAAAANAVVRKRYIRQGRAKLVKIVRHGIQSRFVTGQQVIGFTAAPSQVIGGFQYNAPWLR
jgi:hypothetical protein